MLAALGRPDDLTAAMFIVRDSPLVLPGSVAAATHAVRHPDQVSMHADLATSMASGVRGIPFVRERLVQAVHTRASVGLGLDHHLMTAPAGTSLVASAAASHLPAFWWNIYQRFRLTRYGSICRRNPSKSDLEAAARALVDFVDQFKVRPAHAAEWLPKMWRLLHTEQYEAFDWRRLLVQQV